MGLNAWSSVPDSLLALLPKSQFKAPIYNELAMFFTDSLPQKSYQYAQLAVQHATKDRQNNELGKAHFAMGNYYYNTNHYDSAVWAYSRSVQLLKGSEDYASLSNAHSNLGALYYYKGALKDAVHHFLEAAKYEKLNNKPEEIAVIYNNIAAVYGSTGQYAEAIQYNEKSLAIKIELRNFKGIANSLNNLASIYEDIADYQRSIDYYFKALRYTDSIQDFNLKATILNNIAGVYKNWKQYDKALELYQQAYEIKAKTNQESGLANISNNIGLVYAHKNDFTKALEYYQTAEQLYQKLGDKSGLAASYNNLGSIFEKELDYKQALSYYEKAYQQSIEIGNPKAKAKEALNMARLLLIQNQNNKAETYLNEVLKTALELNNHDLLAPAYGLMSDLYTKQQNPALALKYFKLHTAYKDSIFNKEQHKTIQELNIKYNSEKQLQQIHDMEQLQALNRREIEIQQLKLRQNWFWILGLIFTGFVSIGFLVFSYRQKSLKSKHKELQLEQKLLRSQMNPHFISNALNSIQQFVLSNQPLEAARYLSKFTALMRNTIENSRNEDVSLELELTTLRHYLELQHLRFKTKFSYQIDIDSDLDIDAILIPPMLTQPIIENAIQHAFNHIDYPGQIDIRFSTKDKTHFQVLILDNGQGIVANQSQSNGKHISYATTIIEERMANLKRQTKLKYEFKIFDRNQYDGQNGIVGQFLLPLR